MDESHASTLRSPAKMPLGDWVPPRETPASAGDDAAVVRR